MSSSGTLVLVATPIGNLGDLSARAVETLTHANVIACEDTRHTGKLLRHAGISGVPLMAVHEHNEAFQAELLVERVRNGDVVALVSDAGLPAISDPGQRVVAAVAAAGLRVSVVPGPSAVISAIAISGFSTERFCFEGFLPRKGAARHRRLQEIGQERRTTVIYEAPQRAGSTVADLIGRCGDARRVVFVRELTKLYEEIWRGALGELHQRLVDQTVRGECVLVLEGAPAPQQPSAEDLDAAAGEELASLTPAKTAAAAIAMRLGVPRNVAYDAVIRSRERRGADSAE